MEILELKDFALEGAFFEDFFDERFRSYNWSRFDGKAVRVSSCGIANVPGWVYLTIGIELAGRARKIFFGDKHNPRKLFSLSTDTDYRVKHEA